jgi:hypothetical protein
MPDTKAFDQHYRALSDEELLKLAAEGGFTAEPAQLLGKELARRNLTFDEAKRHFAPEWLDKADVGTLGVPNACERRTDYCTNCRTERRGRSSLCPGNPFRRFYSKGASDASESSLHPTPPHCFIRAATPFDGAVAIL